MRKRRLKIKVLPDVVIGKVVQVITEYGHTMQAIVAPLDNEDPSMRRTMHLHHDGGKWYGHVATLKNRREVAEVLR